MVRKPPGTVKFCCRPSTRNLPRGHQGRNAPPSVTYKHCECGAQPRTDGGSPSEGTWPAQSRATLSYLRSSNPEGGGEVVHCSSRTDRRSRCKQDLRAVTRKKNQAGFPECKRHQGRVSPAQSPLWPAAHCLGGGAPSYPLWPAGHVRQSLSGPWGGRRSGGRGA